MQLRELDENDKDSLMPYGSHPSLIFAYQRSFSGLEEPSPSVPRAYGTSTDGRAGVVPACQGLGHEGRGYP